VRNSWKHGRKNVAATIFWSRDSYHILVTWLHLPYSGHVTPPTIVTDILKCRGSRLWFVVRTTPGGSLCNLIWRFKLRSWPDQPGLQFIFSFQSFVTCPLGIEYIGYTMITLGAANVISSMFVGVLVKRMPREVIIGLYCHRPTVLAQFALWMPKVWKKSQTSH
jgi:hypothetical protein